MGTKKRKKASTSNSIRRINRCTAGADLGAKEHVVAIDPSLVGESESQVRSFSTDTPSLESLVRWLKEKQITSIAMEATGVYWMGIYELLEKADIEVCLVNARHLKNVRGRKTDVIDACWIQELHSYGLLNASFIPDAIYRQLRGYVRQRENLIEEKARTLQHMHKALDMMNVKVHHIIRSIEGKVGMQIVRAIVGGCSDYKQLAQFHNNRLKASKKEFENSLKANYGPTHIFVLNQALQRFDFSKQQIQECEKQIEQLLEQLNANLETCSAKAPQKTKRIKSKNNYTFDLHTHLYQLTGVNLCAIDGMSPSSVLNIISETGTDYSNWKSVAHFTSWLGLAPNDKVSAKKKIGYYKTYGVSRANQTFRLAAFGLANSKCALGAFYRKIRSRKGAKIAIKATARKIAVIFFKMMTNKTEYINSSQQEYNQKYEQRALNSLKRKARKSGYMLVKIDS